MVAVRCICSFLRRDFCPAHPWRIIISWKRFRTSPPWYGLGSLLFLSSAPCSFGSCLHGTVPLVFLRMAEGQIFLAGGMISPPGHAPPFPKQILNLHELHASFGSWGYLFFSLQGIDFFLFFLLSFFSAAVVRLCFFFFCVFRLAIVN